MADLEALNLDSSELEKAQELQKLCPKATPSQVVRFLRARNYKIAKAQKLLESHLEWRENYPYVIALRVRSHLHA